MCKDLERRRRRRKGLRCPRGQREGRTDHSWIKPESGITCPATRTIKNLTGFWLEIRPIGVVTVVYFLGFKHS